MNDWRRFLLPSAADLIFLGLLFSLSCGVTGSRLLNDADTGWQIRNGELILQTHAVTRSDPFSSTMQGQRWYAWEWLYDVLVAGVHHWMGLNGVVFVSAIVIAAAFALTFRVTVASGGNTLLTIILLALAVGASTIHLFARPHIFSWLLVVIWFYMLDTWDQGGISAARHLLWLPPLMLLWVNLHGGFLTGFVLFGIYLLNELAQFVISRDRLRAARIRFLIGVILVCAVATFVNPYGYNLYIHIYQYLTNNFLMNHIQEFRSPDFHGGAQQCFVFLLLIAFAALASAREKLRFSQFLVIIFAAGSGLYTARNLPASSILLVLTVAPILSKTMHIAGTDDGTAKWLRETLERCDALGTRMAGAESFLRGHLWPAVGTVFGLWICLHGGVLGSTQFMDARFSPPRFPVQAVDFIEQHHMNQPVFCPDYWGGYLIYRLYPGVQVVVDDRHDLYGEQFFKQYLKTVQVETGWQNLLNQEKVRVILVPAGSALANVLKESSGWRIAYEDKVGALFQRNSSY